jgi:hypothetical protein
MKPDQLEEAAVAYEGGATTRELGERYGVHHTTILRALRKRYPNVQRRKPGWPHGVSPGQGR